MNTTPNQFNILLNPLFQKANFDPMIFKSFALAAFILAGSAVAANADILSSIQAFTLSDVKTAEAVYAANPSVPTYAAANKCLGWLDTTLSASGAGVTFGNLAAPQGVASTVADIDVALSNAGNVPPIVLAFNDNCGAYVEDLKAEAAAHAVQHFNLFGLIAF